MSVAIVTTTINRPVLLEEYCENARKFGHQDVFFVVVGDKKTPAGVAKLCHDLASRFGFSLQYLSVKDQDRLLIEWPALGRHLPYNSISRRNIGLWQAYKEGAEVIVTIDDDNFVLPDEDFVGWHRAVGSKQGVTEVTSSSGWYNVCELLEEKHGWPFWHRGYPLAERWVEADIKTRQVEAKVVVNAGLWLESPDIDALTWLDLPIETVGYNEKKYPEGVALAKGTWCPFNSQNTALAREVIPAYFLSPFVGRYDDIWASYIVKRIADHQGDAIRFGRPLVKQARNVHDYLIDFDKERMGMELSSIFTAWLRDFELRGSDYGSCFVEITDRLAAEWPEVFEQARVEHKQSVKRFVEGLQLWQELPIRETISA